MQLTKKMGIDFGKARIGIAFSVGNIAMADHIYKTKDEESDLKYLCDLISSQKVDLVVVGMPYNADGTLCEMSGVVKQFAEKLEARSKVKIAFQDERYTSFEAEEYLKEAGVKWEKRKELLDKISAQIILQNYLDEKER